MRCALAVAWVLSGCASPPPDFGRIYNPPARRGEDRNPVILIPGALGSSLVYGPTGQVVWGAFGGSAANPAKDEGARAMALPMRIGAPLESLLDETRAGSVLETASLDLLGFRIEVHPYAEILRTLGAGGYRDQTLGESGAVNYGEAHYTCFQFAYDWRRDVAESARTLGAFIRDRRAYVRAARAREGRPEAPIRFDIVTHSAGSAVARWYLRYGGELHPDPSAPVPWAGAPDVGRVLMIGPPNAGSLETLTRLARDGMRLPPVVSSYPPALSGTQPFIYQLLPRPRHHKIVRGPPPGAPVDVLDPAVWAELGWGMLSPDQDQVLAQLLPGFSAEARRAVAKDHLTKILTRTREVFAALDRPAAPPHPIELHAFVGDAALTDDVLWVGPDRRFEVWDQAPGDGTITRASALLDERGPQERQLKLRSPIAWHGVHFLFSDHLHMTEDPKFKDEARFLLLLEAP